MDKIRVSVKMITPIFEGNGTTYKESVEEGYLIKVLNEWKAVVLLDNGQFIQTALTALKGKVDEKEE